MKLEIGNLAGTNLSPDRSRSPCQVVRQMYISYSTFSSAGYELQKIKSSGSSNNLVI
ncbi:MAG: hypothetical protein ABI855_18420 [Bacteroidota bacterium]